MKHPNTVAGSAGGGAGVLIVYLLGLLGANIPATVGAVIATGAAAAVLFLGRNGLAGVWRTILRGTGQTPAAPKP